MNDRLLLKIQDLRSAIGALEDRTTGLRINDGFTMEDGELEVLKQVERELSNAWNLLEAFS